MTITIPLWVFWTVGGLLLLVLLALAAIGVWSLYILSALWPGRK